MVTFPQPPAESCQLSWPRKTERWFQCCHLVPQTRYSRLTISNKLTRLKKRSQMNLLFFAKLTCKWWRNTLLDRAKLGWVMETCDVMIFSCILCTVNCICLLKCFFSSACLCSSFSFVNHIMIRTINVYIMIKTDMFSYGIIISIWMLFCHTSLLRINLLYIAT